MTAFRKGNYMCIVDRDIAEPIERFIDRGNFILNRKPLTKEAYNEALIYSRIYINVKYLKCVYDDKIMNNLTATCNIKV
jgi:hypothetical protein